jgi:hypothetical protein
MDQHHLLQATTRDVADGAITSAQIASDTIGTANIADNAIASSKIVNSSVTQSKVSFITFHTFNPGQDGWKPDSAHAVFNITGSDLSDIHKSSIITANVHDTPVINHVAVCHAYDVYEHCLGVWCGGGSDVPSSAAIIGISVLNPG